MLADEEVLQAWLLANDEQTSEEQKAVAQTTADALRGYRIPVYLIHSAEEDRVREMFERINTGGRRLGTRDVFLALHSSTLHPRVESVAQLASVPAAMSFGALGEEVAAACARTAGSGDTLDDVARALRRTTEFLRGEAGIPHVRLLPDPWLVPVLVRYTLLHGPPTGRAAVLLRRWLWRSAVAMTADDHSDRPDPAAVADGGDAVDAAGALTGSVPSYPDFLPDLASAAGPMGPMATLVVLGLAAQNPREFGTGEPVDLSMLMQRPRFLAPLLDGHEHATFAGLFLHPSEDQTGQSIYTGLLHAAPDVAASHLADAESVALLGVHDVDGFLARRAAWAGDVRAEAVTRFEALATEFDRRLASLPIAGS